jgi:hypothetical protein
MKTKGATSHVDIKLQDLMSMLSPDATVRVSRGWAKAIGLDGIKPERREAPKTVPVQVEEENTTKLEIGVDNW